MNTGYVLISKSVVLLVNRAGLYHITLADLDLLEVVYCGIISTL
jgi:hypothetical protein